MADPVTAGTKAALTDAPVEQAVPTFNESVPATAFKRRQQMKQAQKFLDAEEGSRQEARALRRLSGVKGSTAEDQAEDQAEAPPKSPPATKPQSFLPAALVERLPEAATYAFQQRLGTAPKPKS